MAYTLKDITIRANNSKEGMEKIDALWQDIVSGKIPLMFDSEGNFLVGFSPVSIYTNYESDENGAYDLKIFTATSEFFAKMDQQAGEGKFQRYDYSGADIQEAANKAWAQVWQDQQAGVIHRAFTEDYESTVPGEYTPDGKAHCYLYIALK